MRVWTSFCVLAQIQAFKIINDHSPKDSQIDLVVLELRFCRFFWVPTVDQEGFQRNKCMLLVRLVKTLCMRPDWVTLTSIFFFCSNFCLGLKDLPDHFCERKLCWFCVRELLPLCFSMKKETMETEREGGKRKNNNLLFNRGLF